MFYVLYLILWRPCGIKYILFYLKKKQQMLVETCTEPGISANICEMEIVDFLLSRTNCML